MIALNNTQGSLQWKLDRLWRLTASEAKSNITSTGKLSKSIAATKSIDKLIAGIDLANELSGMADEIEGMEEWEITNFMSNYTGDKFKGSSHTKRGHEFEGDALAAMSEKIGEELTDVGMVVMGDDVNGTVSCSPDSTVLNSRQIMKDGVEVKCPSLCNYYGIIQRDVFPDDYKMQVHISMAVCEVDVWHFGAFFKGKPLFYKEVKRDSFTDTVEASLKEFQIEYRTRHFDVMAAMEKLKQNQ